MLQLKMSKIWRIKVQAEQTLTRHRFSQQLQKLGVYPKFLIFKLLNVSNKDALSIRKRLFRSAINKRNRELQHVSSELSQSETFLSKQLSTIEFYIFNRSITSHNKKSLQKSLNTQLKKLSSLTRNCSLLTFTSAETIITILNKISGDFFTF